MHRFMTIFICAVIISTLTGCRENKNETSSVSKTENSGTTTISFWTFPVFNQDSPTDSDGTYEQKLIDEFEKEHSNIKVELNLVDFSSGDDKIKTARKNKENCDILLDAPGRIISYAKNGYLIPLNEFFDSNITYDISNSNVLNACKSEDDYYMYPISSAPFYMAFNKAYLEDAGILDIVKEGWTVDDFTKVTKALFEKGYISGSVFCKNTTGDQGTRAFAANLFSGNITDSSLSSYSTDSDKMVKAFEYIQNAVKKGYSTNGKEDTSADAISKFVSGRCSFTLLWSQNLETSNIGQLRRNNVETVSVPYPSDDGKAELEYLINGFCIFDNGDQDRIRASKEFLKFITDKSREKDIVIHTNCIPVKNSLKKIYKDPQMNEISHWQDYYGVYYNNIDGFPEMRKQWINTLLNLLDHENTPRQCADFFTKQANLTIKENYKDSK